MTAPPSSSVVVRPGRPEDDQRILDIHNDWQHDQMPIPVDEYRHWRASRPETARFESWVAELDGEVVAGLDLEESWRVKEPGVWHAFLAVARERTNRGIGSRFYEFLLERAGALHMKRVYAEVREDQPAHLTFATKRGFNPTGHTMRMSRLMVAEAQLASFTGVAERLEREGMRITTIAEMGVDNEPFLRAAHALYERAMADMPSSEASKPRPFDIWVQQMLRWPGSSPEMCWIALDGDEPVGVARLRRQGERGAFNAFTGVDPVHRGRGIARALKLYTVLYARDNGIDYIYTGNDIENHPMLAINVSMGYEPLPSLIEVVKELA